MKLATATGVLYAAGREAICGYSACADCVFANLLTAVKFLELKKLVGNKMNSIADLLVRIKNTSFAGKSELVVPFSKLNEKIALILQKEGILGAVEKIEEDGHQRLALKIKGGGKKVGRIDVKLISKPGRRVYMKSSELSGLRGLWITIVSTPEGLFNAKEASSKNLGGEVICKIMKI